MGKTRIPERIDMILKHINLVQNDIKDMSLADFEKSDLYVRATCFSLVQIGEQMGAIEETLKPSFPNLPWRSAKDMRNLIVHVYNHVKAEVIYNTAKNDLDDLKEGLIFVKEDYLKKQK